MWYNTEIYLATSYIQKVDGPRSIWQFAFVLPVEKLECASSKIFRAKGAGQERTWLRKKN